MTIKKVTFAGIAIALAIVAALFAPIGDTAEAYENPTYQVVDNVRFRTQPTGGSSYNGAAPRGSTITVLCQQWGPPQGSRGNTLWLKVNGSGRNGWYVNDTWTTSPHQAADKTNGIAGVSFCTGSTTPPRPAPAPTATPSLALDTAAGVTCVGEGGASFFIPKRYLALSLVGLGCAYMDTNEVDQLLGSGPADRAIGNIAQACGFSGLAGAAGFALRNTAGKVVDAFCLGTDIGGVYRLHRPSTIEDCYPNCSNWDFVRSMFGFSVGGGPGTGQWAAQVGETARTAASEATASISNVHSRQYVVFGTTGQGLNVRTAPRGTGQLIGQIQDGQHLAIICQVRNGQQVTVEIPGRRSYNWSVWNMVKLPNGRIGYAHDGWTDVPADGGGIPSC